MPYTIIVFSHLRWNFVYQRPQHLLARMASSHRIIFFEEPVNEAGSEPHLELTRPEAGVLVCRPHTPSMKTGFHDDHTAWLESALQQLIYEENILDYLVWFYTPMALPLARNLDPRLIVYDCMDELSGFLNAPEQLMPRETALLEVADLVFTGGPSLYEAKRHHHPEVHCFPSSVDSSHFAKARSRAIEQASQKELPRPRLGYFGVLDERVDPGLLGGMAEAHPEWQIILVGPVVKVRPESLPRLRNIHYFGQQQYDDLPSYLSGWDVCLIPFALNNATRYISPTKTLEYMAAEKPIVSTPITDVAKPYGDIVFIAEGTADFIRSCEEALAMSPAQREKMISGMRRVLASTSWDATVEAMERLITKTASRKAGSSVAASSELGVSEA